jgi:hypothetical protein
MVRVKERKNIFQANKSQKQAKITIFIFYKTDFKQKLVQTHKEGHFIFKKGTIH